MKPRKFTFKLKSKGKPHHERSVSFDVNSVHARVLAYIISQRRPVKKEEIIQFFQERGHHEFRDDLKQITLMRGTQSILRDLRDADVPLVGTIEGCWIARSVEEIQQFTKELRTKIKRDTKSEWALVKRMERNDLANQLTLKV